MERACDSCRQKYEARRPSSRFCGPTCRQRARRGMKPAVIGSAPPPPDPDVVPPLVARVIRDLDTAGRLDTTPGQQAVLLATRLSSPHETGASVASMNRELRATMAEALQGTAKAADHVDEVKARRDRKFAGLAG